MIRLTAITIILLWILLLLAGLFLYVSALVLCCEGQYLGFTISIVLSILYILNFIDGSYQIPSYLYQIIHNYWKYEDDDDVPLMIWKDKSEK